MKRLSILLMFVLSASLLGGPPNAQNLSSQTDRTKVCMTGMTQTRSQIQVPIRQLLDDNSLLAGRSKRSPGDTRAEELMKQSGIRFQENRGQIVDTEGKVRTDIAFIASAPGARLYFRNDGISYVFTKSDMDLGIPALEGISRPSEAGIRNENDDEGIPPFGRDEINQSYRLDMTLAGSNPDVRIRAEGELSGYVNYYLPQRPNGIIGIREYSRIVYENVYDDVDLELFSVNGRMKYNFIVRPGGDARDIRMQYDDASETSLTADGAVAVVTALGRIEEAAPYTYAGEEVNAVQSRFLRKGNTVSFAVDEYDRSQTLVIDPWATYYGGSGSWDLACGLATDSGGNVVISGYTGSTSFPVSTGAHQTASAGGNDAFIVKFGPDGSRLWATYYGGTNDDGHYCKVSTDGTGNIAISGWTKSVDFPVTAGAFQKVFGGEQDIFIVKFNENGTRLWSTFYGGRKSENSWGSGGGIYTDVSGNIIVCGSTYSTNFPVSVGAFQTNKSSGKSCDAVVIKLNPNGGRIWATYYGGNQAEAAYDIAADASGNVYSTGEASGNFPVTSGAFQISNAGLIDGYLVKFTSTGSRMWSTYYGGSAQEKFQGICIDGSGDVVLAGGSASTNFPVSTNAYQPDNAGHSDAVVVKFSGAGSRIWATYYGGSVSESAYDIAVDASGNIVFTGSTGDISGSNFPISPDALQPAFGGGSSDAFVVKMSSACTRTWATFYGGSANDWAYGVASTVIGDIVFGGQTSSMNFPLYGIPFQSSLAGGTGTDAFLVMLNANGLFSKESASPLKTPASIELDQNYPNPFNPTTVIRYQIPKENPVHLQVFDLHGRVVIDLVREIQPAGSYSIEFDGKKLRSGTYLYRVESGGQCRIRQMTVIK